jgi:hypothetical protein
MSGWVTFQVPSSVGSLSPDTTLLMTDGSVLIHDAYGKNWVRLYPDGNGNYESGTWSSLLPMANTRQFFASGILPDGRVFAVGGEYSDAESSGEEVPEAEIFDPQTNMWSSLSKPAAFNYIQGDASGCVLADGRVLFGNLQTTSPPFSTALWDPVTNVWTVAGSAFGTLTSDSKSANCNEETWTLLPDGSVLTVNTLNSPHSERYIPSLDRWVSTGDTPTSLVLTSITDPSNQVINIDEIGPALLLPDGRLFAVGGSGQTALYTPPPAGSDPTTNPGTWQQGPAFPATPQGSVWPNLTCSDAPGVLQTNGKVLCTAGLLYLTSGKQPDYFSENAQFFEFDPSDNSLNAFTPAPIASSSAPNTWTIRFLLLPTAQIMMTTQGGDIYLYTPDPADNDPDPSWKPTLTSVPQNLVQGHTYTITGTQLNGMSQAVSYGDDAQQATNYPIFQLSNSSGQVVYLRSFSFSTMAVATGSTPVTADVEIPDTVTPGTWQLVAIANGIPSDAVDVQVVAQDCYLTLDRNTFGEGEIKAIINLGGAPAVVSPALYVVVEGYTAAEAGLTAGNLSNPPHPPTIPDPLTGLSAVFAGPVLPEDPALPSGEIQRFTFPYSLQFSGSGVFAAAPENVTVTATFGPPGQPSVSGSAVISLIANPDPFILHGDEAAGYPWYLSTDLRVFQIAAGGTRFGATVSTSGSADTVATDFIQTVISNLNSDAAAAGPLFDAIAQDETSTALSLAQTDGSTPVYNFALARVRLQDVAAAPEVGVFFRLWQAQQTNATYDPTTTYASVANPAGDLVPLLGVAGDEIMTIPFFATPRVDSASVSMQTQTDTFNRLTIQPDPLGAEADAYFGCWLDINQPNELRFPDRMVGGNPADIPAGPFTGMGTLLSIQQLVRSTHQCLIAEISFGPDPVTPGSDPSNSDKLAQRNLTLIPAPNPGAPESRVIPQTLEIRPTPSPLPYGRPDELMIDWGNIPTGTTAELFLPAASAAGVLDLADSLYVSHRLTVVDAHTVGMIAGGVTYVPVPQGGTVNYAGLFTAYLPAGITRGQEFEVVVKQLTTESAGGDAVPGPAELAPEAVAPRFIWRRVCGVFKLQIPVGTKQSILPTEERTLAIMRWIGESIPVQSRWYPVFQRYLSQEAGRVSQMGGDPSKIPPSSTGHVPFPPGGGGRPGRGGPGKPPGGWFGDWVEFTGKIEGLIHDRFGDFEGFFLEERQRGEILRFRSREEGIAVLAERAWHYRTVVSVFVAPHRLDVPATIVLRETPSWD